MDQSASMIVHRIIAEACLKFSSQFLIFFADNFFAWYQNTTTYSIIDSNNVEINGLST